MSEFWFNVYDTGDGYYVNGERHAARGRAVSGGMARAGNLRLAYRIHVRMKQEA